MTTTRTVNRRQVPSYEAGSVAAGRFTYSVQGIERRGASVEYYDLCGDPAEFPAGNRLAAAEARHEAQKAAWRAARAWVSELGPLTRTDSEIRSGA